MVSTPRISIGPAGCRWEALNPRCCLPAGSPLITINLPMWNAQVLNRVINHWAHHTQLTYKHATFACPAMCTRDLQRPNEHEYPSTQTCLW